MGFPREEYWSWVAIFFSRRSSWPTDWTQVFCIAGDLLHSRETLYQLSYQVSPNWLFVVVKSFSCVWLFATLGLLHTRLPCPSLSPGVHSDSLSHSWLTHWVNDTIQPSHILSPPFPHALNLSQHQGLFQWAGSSHQVTKVLECQLQCQSFQRVIRVDFP